MLDGRVIRGVDANAESFRKCLRRIKDTKLREEILSTLKVLLFVSLDAPPAKLHMHQLKNKDVPSATQLGKKVPAWTIHVTANDAYKASFTLEDGTAYLRLCDEHDVIDRNP